MRLSKGSDTEDNVFTLQSCLSINIKVWPVCMYIFSSVSHRCGKEKKVPLDISSRLIRDS